ncbi:MAG TPA: hypothetical protein VLB04_01980 [Methanotrichaceae archaeon]|nr:hypothetical protein [Methanotrichaceae archaeon]
MIQGAGGIEVLFSQDDMSISSYYDVDDSIAVEEEASATYGSGITDYREVSGNGHIYADQQLKSGSYWAIAGAYGPDGRSVSGGASITPTALNVWQSALVRGHNAYAFVDGEQNYWDGKAVIWQDAAVEDGWVSSKQGLTLGSSIFSTQKTQASGLRPYATGFAGISSPSQETDGVNDQIAIIELSALEEGSVRGSLGAEVVRTPVYIDPVAYGSGTEASGDEAAGLVAGAGSIEGTLPENFFISGSLFDIDPENLLGIFSPKEDLIAHGALTGAIGAGSKSLASAGYLEAGTDGQESYAYSEDISAKGNDLAAVAAATGYIEKYSEDDIFGDIGGLEVQGALAGAIGAGKDSMASARYLEADTNYWETYAFGEKMKAKGNGLAAVAAGAGYLKESSSAIPVGYYEDLHVDGALAGAVGAGENSKASANYLEAGTDYWDTYAYGKKMKAKGDSFAAVAAGAGNLEIESEFGISGDHSHLVVQGALAGAAGAGEDSEASARYLEADTDGYYSGASGRKLKAKGDEFAAVLTGAGDLGLSSYYGIRGKGAIAGGLAEGKKSKVSAGKVETYTDYWWTEAEVKNLDAKGKDGVLAGALSIYGPVPALPPISLAGTGIVLDQGALKNANFRAEVADDFWMPTTLTASGEADLENAIGIASAFTLNPSDIDGGLIDPAKTHASMNAEAEQGWPPITSVTVT